jgi:hypothetical protein
MRLPDQSPPVQRSLNQVGVRPTAVSQAPAELSSNFDHRGCVSPSGTEECYGLQGAARELCLGALRDY